MTRTSLTGVVSGLDADPTQTVTIDRFLYTSTVDARELGYRVVARSPGLQEDEAVEATVTFGLLGTRLAVPGFERYPTGWIVYRLRSGRVCVGRIDDAGRDPLKRPGRFAVTGLVLAPEIYRDALGGMPPTRLLQALDPDRTLPVLAPLVVPVGSASSLRPQTEEAVSRLLSARPEAVAALLRAGALGERVIVTSPAPQADDLLAVLRLFPPAERRVSLVTTAFAWGQLCERVAWVGSPRALLEQHDPPHGVRVIDWYEPPAAMGVGGKSCYAAEVERLLREGDASALGRLLRDLEELASLPVGDAEVQAYFAYLRARSVLERGTRLAPADAAAAISGALKHAEPQRAAQLHAEFVVAATAEDDRGALLALLRERRRAAPHRPCERDGLRAAFAQLVASRRWLAALALLGDAPPAERDRLAVAVDAWARGAPPAAMVELAAGIVDLRGAGAWDVAERATVTRILETTLTALDRHGALAQAERTVLALAEPAIEPSSAELELAARFLPRFGRHAQAAELLLWRGFAATDAKRHAVDLLATAPSGALDAGLLVQLAQLAFGVGEVDEVARRVQAWAEAPGVSPWRVAEALGALAAPEVAGAVLAAARPEAARPLVERLRAVNERLYLDALASVGPYLVAEGEAAQLLALLPPGGLSVSWRERLTLWSVDRSFGEAVRTIDRRRAVAMEQAVAGAARVADHARRQLEEKRRGAVQEHAKQLADLEEKHRRRLERIDTEVSRVAEERTAQVRAARAQAEAETLTSRDQARAARARWASAVAWRRPTPRWRSSAGLLAAACAVVLLTLASTGAPRPPAGAPRPSVEREELEAALDTLRFALRSSPPAGAGPVTSATPRTAGAVGNAAPVDSVVSLEPTPSAAAEAAPMSSNSVERIAPGQAERTAPGQAERPGRCLHALGPSWPDGWPALGLGGGGEHGQFTPCWPIGGTTSDIQEETSTRAVPDLGEVE